MVALCRKILFLSHYDLRWNTRKVVTVIESQNYIFNAMQRDKMLKAFYQAFGILRNGS